MRRSASGASLSANQIKAETVSADNGEPVKRWRFFDEYQNDRCPFEVQVDTDEKEDVFAGIGVSVEIRYHLLTPINKQESTKIQARSVLFLLLPKLCTFSCFYS